MSAAAAETARLATEAEWERKLERLRRFRDGSGPEPLNQGSVMLLKGGQEQRARVHLVAEVIHAIRPQNEHLMMLSLVSIVKYVERLIYLNI